VRRTVSQARLLARQFKELPEKEAKKWEKKAEQDKIRYQEEMKHYVPVEDPTGGGGGGGGKTKKAKKVGTWHRQLEYPRIDAHI
jgi:hypothetical protein